MGPKITNPGPLSIINGFIMRTEKMYDPGINRFVPKNFV